MPNCGDTQNEIIDTIMDNFDLGELLTREYIKFALSDIVTFDKKQHDRGPENIARHGAMGVVLRLWDKLARIDRVIIGGGTLKVSEPIEQDLVDVSVYGVIARMCRAGVWPGVPAVEILPIIPDADDEVVFRSDGRRVVGSKVEVTQSIDGTWFLGPAVGDIGFVQQVTIAGYLVAFAKQPNWDGTWFFNTLNGETDGVTIRRIAK